MATDDPLEQAHLDSSDDGLKHFIPVDIYSENITAIEGLIPIFRLLQNMEGFGTPESVLVNILMLIWRSSGNYYEHSIAIQLSQEYMTYFSFWFLA